MFSSPEQQHPREWEQDKPDPTVVEQLRMSADSKQQEPRRDTEVRPDYAKRAGSSLSSEEPTPVAPPKLQALHLPSSDRNEIRSSIGRLMNPRTQNFKPKELRSHRPQEWPFPSNCQTLRVNGYYRDWIYKVSNHGYTQGSSLKVVIHRRALDKIFDHACGDLRNERFGILIGGVFTDPRTQGNWVEIVDMLPAQRVRANVASVEVSTEEISRLNVEIDQILVQTQEKVRKLGWYHTHPNHGIFMSGTDRTNQKLCYNAEWQVALVVDPIRRQYGMFSGPECLPLFDIPLLLLPEQAARVVNTPAYQLWQNVSVAQPGEGASVDAPEFRREFPPRISDASGATIENELHEEVDQQQYTGIPKLGKGMLNSMLHYPLVELCLLVLLVFSLSANAILFANLMLERKADEHQMQLDKQQLVSLAGQLQSNSQVLQQTQQNLLNQANKINDMDALAYRQLLDAVVILDRKSNEGKNALSLLKNDISYTAVKGDSPEVIVRKFKITLDAFYEKNPDLDRSNPIIKVGDVFTIPGETAP